MAQVSTADTSALTLHDAADQVEGLLSDTETEVAPETQADEEEESPEVAADTSEEESEDSQDPDDESEEDEEPNEEQPELRTFRVKVDGEEVEVAEDELLRGYSRTQDYTRKTQQVAEQRKAIEAEQAAVRATRETYASKLEQISQMLSSAQPSEPDWAALREEGPEVFAAAYAEWDIHQRQVQAVEAERARVAEEAQAEQVAAFQQHLAAENALLVSAIPSWNDVAVAKKERGELVEYAKELGYTDDDLRQVVDHRVLLMLRKSMLFDRAEKAKPAVKQVLQKKIERAKPVTPGSPATARKPVSALARANQRLAKTGRLEDAASAILLLDD